VKAVRLIEPRQPLKMQEVEIPSIGPQDVLVRVKAAGICHSDVHYRTGISPVNPLPMTLGHEVSGLIEKTGSGVTHLKPGDRVSLHYMVTCGHCTFCSQGSEQFCTSGKMIGKYRDGGYAEYIAIPARSAFRLPDEIPFEQGAILMCSSATSFHAIQKARLRPTETVAIFGAGGLGFAALQIAQAYGASQVYVVDIKTGKLEMAQKFGAIPVNASQCDPVAEIKKLTGGRGVDVALELIGLPLTMRQAFQSLAIMGRVAIAGVTDRNLEIAPYDELINKEAEIIGVSDHLAQEIPQLFDLVMAGKLNAGSMITQTIPLDEIAINKTMDRLEKFSDDVRVVITP
jgi:2-desacetyl-2-hydroxyethyl bacteriochlorophyllide A dehydrogenase